MTVEQELLLAANVAARAHQHAKRMDGTPYIAHPIRVAIRCETALEKTVALLHDVVEDTDVTFEELRELGFSSRTLEILDKVTKRTGEKYFDFIRRCLTDPVAVQIKLADIADNLSDQSTLDPDDAAYFRTKYGKALDILHGRA